MTLTTRYRGCLAALGVLFIAGCGSATRLTSVWIDPGFKTNSLHKLMIIGIATTPAIRRAFEDRFAAALKAQGIEAEPSYPLVGDGNLDSARVSAAMHRTGCDGVFVTRLVDQKTVTTYYPPIPSHLGAPSAYYYGWYGYYSLGYSYLGAPGYTIQSQVVHFETNLYRVSDDHLVWSALSREWLDQSQTPGEEVDPFVRQLVSGLVRTRVVRTRQGAATASPGLRHGHDAGRAQGAAAWPGPNMNTASRLP
ncbi:MAG: hypothetical protein SFV24_05375 [Gemmatimonadales bacterium]|nr:hypothetical protein [Gemmatimonadales bacterium]